VTWIELTQEIFGIVSGVEARGNHDNARFQHLRIEFAEGL
jgi:hypothetical protein